MFSSVSRGLLSVLLVVVVLETTNAALSRTLATELPAFPGKCYIDELEEALMVGESRALSGSCGKVFCNLEENQLIVTSHSCGKASPPPGCDRTLVDLTKTYPDCCPSFKCPEIN